MSASKIQLGYWKIRGLAEPIRLLLKYAAADFEDVVYECGDAPEFDKSCWFDVKFKLGLDFPNLPYLKDGDVKLSQTISILHYVASKYNLLPPESEKYQCEMVESFVLDIVKGWAMLCYASEESFKQHRDASITKFKELSSQLSKYIGEKNYIAGKVICCTDFFTFEILDKMEKLDPNILNDFGNLKAYVARIKSDPKLKDHFNDKSSSWFYPLNNKMAYFK